MRDMYAGIEMVVDEEDPSWRPCPMVLCVMTLIFYVQRFRRGGGSEFWTRTVWR